MPKIFISGPMTGYPEWNFPKFIEVAADLRTLDYDVFNFVETMTPEEMTNVPTWEKCMKRAIPELCKCDIVLVLDGWRKSQGARTEVFFAQLLKLRIYDEFLKDITDDIGPVYLPTPDPVIINLDM
jgi:hypothetical protein